MRVSVALVLALGLAAIACKGGGSNSSTPTSPSSPSAAVIIDLSITGTTQFTAAGQTSQLTATATFSDGTTQNVTALASWSTSNASQATVSSSGLVTVVATVSASPTITATYSGRSATRSLTITIAAPNIAGTWVGAYGMCCGLFLQDGEMTLQVTQNGSSFTATFTLVDSFLALLGGNTVNGTMQGSWSVSLNSYYPVTGSIPNSANLSCGSAAATINNTQIVPSLTVTPPILQIYLDGTVCGGRMQLASAVLEKR